MKDVEFQCPQCAQWLEAPGDMVSLFVECPSCESIIKVPSPSEAATPTSTAPEQPPAIAPDENDTLKGCTMRIELPPNLGLPPPPKRQFILRRPK